MLIKDGKKNTEMIFKMKILVTGGAGFIGSHVVDELVSRGHQVTVLDDLSVGEYKNIPRNVEFVLGDIRDAEKVRFCMEGKDAVFHFAYDATECKSIFSPVLDADINIIGGLTVLKEAINEGVETFVFPGSVIAYGVPKYLPMDEKHPLIPDDPYAVTKIAFEQYLRVFYELGKIKPYIIRFVNTYGPRLRLDNPYKGVTQIFISRTLQGKSPTIFGDGKQTRGFTYVEDIKKPIVDILDHPEFINKPLNIGSDFVHSIEDVANIITRIINPKIKPKYLPERLKDVEHAYCDVKLMEKVMGYKCKTTMEEGLKKTIEWAKKQDDIKFKYNWPIEIPSLMDEHYSKKQI